MKTWKELKDDYHYMQRKLAIEYDVSITQAKVWDSDCFQQVRTAWEQDPITQSRPGAKDASTLSTMAAMLSCPIKSFWILAGQGTHQKLR